MIKLATIVKATTSPRALMIIIPLALIFIIGLARHNHFLMPLLCSSVIAGGVVLIFVNPPWLERLRLLINTHAPFKSFKKQVVALFKGHSVTAYIKRLRRVANKGRLPNFILLPLAHYYYSTLGTLSIRQGLSKFQTLPY